MPQVAIDADGTFKYVLLRLSDKVSGRSTLLVRGTVAAGYHNHILQHTKAEVAAAVTRGSSSSSGGGGGQPSWSLEPLGGGRIAHEGCAGRLHVYGYSAAFGPAVHEVTVALLRRWHPFHDAITFSYEGY